MIRRREDSEWVIWLTIVAIGIYMATQYIGPLPSIVSQPPASAPPSQPQPKRRFFPLFPRGPHAPDSQAGSSDRAR